tara:strand:- start:244 stop:558 length:315 start_codon:yes stop_codon:yes gene_type:complete
MADKYNYNNKNRNMAGNPIHQPTESYKKGWDRIFRKKTMEKDFLEEVEKEKKELNESYKESKRQTAERKQKEKTESEKSQEDLEPIDEKFLDDIANNTPNSGQF